MPRASRKPADPQLHVFTGPQALYYPEAHDAAGRSLGESEACPEVRAKRGKRVEPGDCRVFRDAPDSMWRPASQEELGAWLETAEDEPALALLGIETGIHLHPGMDAEMTAVEHPADGTMSPEISNRAEPGDGEAAE